MAAMRIFRERAAGACARLTRHGRPTAMNARSLCILAWSAETRSQPRGLPAQKWRGFTTTAAWASHSGSAMPDPVADGYITSSVLDLMSLKDRVVVITGAAKGIGLALAFAVAEVGGRIAIIDAMSSPDGAFARLQEQCTEVRYYQSDVTDYDSLQATFASVAQDFGRIDGLITAAGICPDEPFLQRSPASVKRCLEINSLGTYYSAQLAARQMASQPQLPNATAKTGAGSIVLIASIAAHRASKAQYTSDYCMSKGAVLSLTRQLGVELADRQIRVNCISPGYIMTDMTADLVIMRPDLGQVFNEEPAMGRIGDRTDLKAASVYLLSDASAYMTSAEMLITGGMHAGKVHS